MDTKPLTEQYEVLANDLKRLKNQRRLDLIKLTCFSVGFFGGVYGTLLVLNKAPQEDHHKND